MAVVGLMASATTVLAQSTPATAPTIAPAPVTSSIPPLAYGVPQVLQLVQAKISDDTVIAYINNSRINYGLDANQIIYLRQQGVSDAVVSAMLNQPKPGAVAAAPAAPTATPAPAPAQVASAPVAPTVTYVQSQPTVTYVQTPPTTYYYTQPYYYYPSYAYYPPVSLSFGFGWGGGWRGGYHGGYRGGWHR